MCSIESRSDSTIGRRHVLVLGCGLVSGPLISYLTDSAKLNVLIATRSISKADPYKGIARIAIVEYDIERDISDGLCALRELVSSVDVVVSLLPYIHHVAAANIAIELKKHFCTTSYISDEMMAMDPLFKEASLTCLNECGVDPGLDHMSAMAVADRIASESPGAKLVSFQSLCGGLPSVESNTNPFGYKLSWSPRGVLLAGRNSAKVLVRGEEIEVPGNRLFSEENVHSDVVEGIGALEWYFNRDSVKYKDIYKMKDATTVIRGTYRYPGWSRLLSAISGIGLNSTEPLELKGCSFTDLVRKLLQKESGDAKALLAEQLCVSTDDTILQQLEWLGIISDDPIPSGITCPLDVMCLLMAEKMQYSPGEKDMIVMRHEFEVEYTKTDRRTITSTLVNIGLQPDGQSSMARTVALPIAVAVHALVEKRLSVVGVVRPVIPELYVPILEAMSSFGVTFHEQTLSPLIWLRAEVKEGERRAPLVPSTVDVLVKAGFRVNVERSELRCFPASEYKSVGAKIVESGSWINAPHSAIIMGLKELPGKPDTLFHRHIFFAHAFKEQIGWREELGRFKKGGGHIWDLEFLSDIDGRRVAAFGKAAGSVGMALGLQAWACNALGKTLSASTPHASSQDFADVVKASLTEALQCPGRGSVPKVLVLGALGRCGSGAVSMAQMCGLDARSIIQWDLEETKNGGPFPQLLEVDIIVNCVYLSKKIEPFLTPEMLNDKPDRHLSVVVDVSCDFTSANNPLPIYAEATTLRKPVLTIDYGGAPLSVVSIDHLPTLIPSESSTEFSTAMESSLLELTDPDNSPVWSSAAKLFESKIDLL